jgi:hypothetical protein
VDNEDAFEMFIRYIYMLHYEAPSGLPVSEVCVLHARVYVLAERLCMEDLKAEALCKMSSTLGQNNRQNFLTLVQPETVLDLIEIVYGGTRDDERWFETIEANEVDDNSPEELVEEPSLERPAEEPPREEPGEPILEEPVYEPPLEEPAAEEDVSIYGLVTAGDDRSSRDVRGMIALHHLRIRFDGSIGC